MYAVIFPGQGSQKPGMGIELLERFPEAREVFEAVSSATGQDMVALCREANEETLRRTENAQLALYTTGLAAFRVLASQVGDAGPAAFAGHSVGEYAAIAASGAISIESGAKLVQRRGELMADSGKLRPGSMAAVLGLEREDLEKVCQEASTDGVAVIANDNCPGQLVISGDVDAVQRASALASDRGAKRVLPLNVSGAFHSPLMTEPARHMRAALDDVVFTHGTGPVYANVTTEPVPSPDQFPQMLETQLMHAVLWTDTIRHMIRDGIQTFVECGSGEVLTGLIRRIDREVEGLKVIDPSTLDTTLSTLIGVKS